MKLARLTAALLALSTLAAPASPSNCKHIFWIFGRDHIYLSHKPEIGSPCHGYQVIVEVAMDPATTEAYQRLQAAGGEMTMEFPEHFLLDEIREGETMPVRATLHDGNVEDKEHYRSAVATKIPVRVVRKVLFRKLTQGPPQGVMHAFVFGTPEELYMCNRVDQKPDFDQIVQIETDGADKLLEKMRSYPIPTHDYRAGRKPEMFLADDEKTSLMDGTHLHDFRVVRKLELTFSNDAFAASH